VNRYDILLGKGKNLPPATKKIPTIVNHKGQHVILSKFRIEIAKAKRVCTECHGAVYKNEPCIKAFLVDQQIYLTKKGKRYWKCKKIQLCHRCAKYVGNHIEKFKSSQDATSLISDFQIKYTEYLYL
jgi:hypothetical protein